MHNKEASSAGVRHNEINVDSTNVEPKVVWTCSKQQLTLSASFYF